MASCNHCSATMLQIFQQIFENNEKTLAIFRSHGVLPSMVMCGKCKVPCNRQVLENGKIIWRCYKTFPILKTKRRRACNFTSTDYKGTFLSHSRLEPWQIAGFIAFNMQSFYTHEMASENFHISLNTCVDWRSFCSEVMISWYDNQEPIGGHDIVVEIDETLITRRKYGVGRVTLNTQQVWLFGGIERASKKRFVIPLLDDNDEPLPRSREVLMGYIIRFIKPGTTIYSDEWAAYRSLKDEGYIHKTVNHSVNFLNPDDPNVHTQTIERSWQDVKKGIKRQGMRRHFLRQYLGRYLFLTRFGKSAFHQFLLAAARLYPPQGERKVVFDEQQDDEFLYDYNFSDDPAADTNL